MKCEIVIRNKTKSAKIFILAHNEVCLKAGKCFCRKGKPISVHVPVGIDTPANVAALRSSEVVRAINDRQIEIIPTEKATGRPIKPGTAVKTGTRKGKAK